MSAKCEFKINVGRNNETVPLCVTKSRFKNVTNTAQTGRECSTGTASHSQPDTFSKMGWTGHRTWYFLVFLLVKGSLISFFIQQITLNVHWVAGSVLSVGETTLKKTKSRIKSLISGSLCHGEKAVKNNK